MNRIIKSLVNNRSLLESKNILSSYNSTDWKQYVAFNKEDYKKNLVYRDNNFEMFVVCWLPYQETKIHNHSENGCLLKILEGNMVEEIYDKNFVLRENNNLIKDNVRYIDDSIGIHKMKNNEENTISLHIYSPPNFIPTLLK
jgi:cysteine dioxygenase